MARRRDWLHVRATRSSARRSTRRPRKRRARACAGGADQRRPLVVEPIREFGAEALVREPRAARARRDLRQRAGSSRRSADAPADVVVKHGARLHGRRAQRAPRAGEAEVVDTTGAGDALAAGYLVGGPSSRLEAAARCVATLGRCRGPVDEVRAALDAARRSSRSRRRWSRTASRRARASRSGSRASGACARPGPCPRRSACSTGGAGRPGRWTSSSASARGARKVGPRDVAACGRAGRGRRDDGGRHARGLPRTLGSGSWGPAGSAASTAAGRSGRRLRRPRRARAYGGVVVASGCEVDPRRGRDGEVLETLGVPTLGFRTETLPLFYSAAAAARVGPRRVGADEAAAIARAHWNLGGAGSWSATHRRRASTTSTV